MEANWNDPSGTASKADHRNCTVKQQKMPALIYASRLLNKNNDAIIKG
jgi:hypothetical protein